MPGGVTLHIVGVLGLLKHPQVQFGLVLSRAPKCPSLRFFWQGIRQDRRFCLANQDVAWLYVTVNVTYAVEISHPLKQLDPDVVHLDDGEGFRL